MNKTEAKKLAEKVTNEELRQMFLNAQRDIKNWGEVGRVNMGITKGTAFNLLSKGFSVETFDPNKVWHNLAKRNMIWEFGEYLPGYEKPRKKPKSTLKPAHQKPNFI